MYTLKLFLVFASLTSSLACTCKRYHPQELFCRSEYVLRMRVIGDVQTDKSTDGEPLLGRLRFEKIYYPIRITKIYKGNLTTVADLKTLRRVTGKTQYISRLYVPPRMSSCSLSLTEGETYVIMGQIHEGVLHHGLCNWRSYWRDITSVQRHGFKRQYSKGCECTIRTCPSRRWCKTSQLATECRWVLDYGYAARKCIERYQVCKYNNISRSCKWRQPDHPSFKKCIEQEKYSK